MVPRGMLVVERRLPQPMRDGIYAECRMVNERQPQKTSIDIAATRIAPSKPGNDSGQGETHEKTQSGKVVMLPPDHRIFRQIADIRRSLFSAGLNKEPANM